MSTSYYIPVNGRFHLQELEAEEERLWKEQVEAAESHAGAAGEKYRRDREVGHSPLQDWLD